MERVKRITSIDFLRGWVMIIMALDHVRDFFHYDAYLFDPTDLSQTSAMLFLTRFVTHFCAPVFVFLAGTSAFFVGQRSTKSELSFWLLKRGIWLIIVELTLVKLGWNFTLSYSMNVLQVIFALGMCMIFLAAFIHVPRKIMIAVSMVAIFGHNALDGFSMTSAPGLWTFIHEQAPVTIGSVTFFVAYPLLPWIFVMPLGYHFGQLYVSDFSKEERVKWLRTLGVSSLLIFVILRGIVGYGDSLVWVSYDSVIFNLLSFINVSKYPPSLHFLLITLGATFILLSFVESWKGKVYDAIVTVGRVPMFYYIIHLYIIHFFALIAAVATGFPVSAMIIDLFVTFQAELKGYGFSLWVVYGVWLAVVAILYPISTWYWKYKSSNRDKWWLSYL